MNDETRDIGFTGDIKIPKEIQNIKADIFWGFDLRELKCLALGVILAGVVAYIAFRVLHSTSTIAVMSPAMAFAPFLILAKIKKNGMNMEDWLLICYSNNFKSRPIRVNEVMNDYQRLERIYQSKFEKKSKSKENKKELLVKKKELKARKKASPYKAFL